MNRSMLVIYHIPEFRKEKQLAGLCRRLGIMTRKIKPGDVSVPVGILSGIGRGSGKRQAIPVPNGFRMPELLIFAGFTSEELDGFLAEYKKAGIQPVALRAVVTMHNSGWSLYELICELQREHEELSQRNGD